MALEAVVFSSQQDPFSYISSKDNFLFQDFYFQDQESDFKNSIKLSQDQEQDQELKQDQELLKGKGEELVRSKNEDYNEEDLLVYRSMVNTENQAQAGGGRRKRRRTRSSKNKEEMENQRMTHIAVERNRRKQMNDYLGVLRSLMPPSYAQRGDQASIIGGAINYVKELEHLLQSMESSKSTKTTTNESDQTNSSSKVPFSDFFTFPQFSTRSSSSAAAEIEVTMVESHANLKILVKKRPRQLIKLVASIQSLKLTLLHLNVTTLHLSVLYSISVKVEEGSQLNTVEDIAAAVNQILRRIEEEFSSSSSLSSSFS